MNFKKGDTVKFIGSNSCCSADVGATYTVMQNGSSLGIGNHYDNLCSCKNLWSLIDNKINMNIKEKFITAFLSEPEKSFRKLGVTNGDGFLTEDGQSMFLSWLLKNNGVEFKKEVVDSLLKEQEKENK